jgi:hypothetical protein
MEGEVSSRQSGWADAVNMTSCKEMQNNFKESFLSGCDFTPSAGRDTVPGIAVCLQLLVTVALGDLPSVALTPSPPPVLLNALGKS